ncbi:MAG: serine hydrolase [Bacteroidales bacterium]
MKKIILFLIFNLWFAALCVSQSFNAVWAGRFQTVLDSARIAGSFKSLSAAVYFPGEGLWSGVSGINTTGEPMTSEFRMGVASNTKLFIATALLKLQEQGILSIDDPLYEWLPEHTYIDSTITIRQLLQHQSGIYSYFQNENGPNWPALVWGDTSHMWTTTELLDLMQPPNFQTGHGTKYCNTGYMIASMILEAATSSSWFQKLHDFTFTPLYMDSTFVGAFESRNGPVAHEWCYNGAEISQGPMTALYSVLNAAGAVFSTPLEMVHWYDQLFNGSFLSDSCMHILTQFEPSSMMGLGIFARDNPVTGDLIFEHGGDSWGYHSETMYFPGSKSVLSVMTNGGTNEYIGTAFFPLMNVLNNEYPKKDNDAGITGILSPRENTCNTSIITRVNLKNFGTAPLTSVTIHSIFDNNPALTFQWTGSLAAGTDLTFDLPATIPGNGYHRLKCYTSMPNGDTEGYTFNDTARSDFVVNASVTYPSTLIEGFEGAEFPPPGWILNNRLTTNWGRTRLTEYNGSACAVKDAFDDMAEGSSYILTMPMINVTGVSNPELRYFYSYQGTVGTKDSLVVEISGDCGQTWEQRFAKGGFGLGTVNFFTPDRLFYPQLPSHWKEEVISLSQDTGNLLIRFRCVNDWGNNLYLDYVRVGNFTGYDDEGQAVPFMIYPNPTMGSLQITGLPLHTEILITDVTGKLISSQITAVLNPIIDLQKYPTGIYFLKTLLGTKKIVKM